MYFLLRYSPLADVWEPVTSHNESSSLPQTSASSAIPPSNAAASSSSSVPSSTTPSLSEDKILTSTSVDGDLYAMRLRNKNLFLDKLEGATLKWIPCCSVDMPLTMQAMCPRPVCSDSWGGDVAPNSLLWFLNQSFWQNRLLGMCKELLCSTSMVW